MRFAVNLASEPFRRDRPMIVASTMVGILLTGVLAMLIYLALAERERAAEARATIEKLDAQMQALSREEAKLQTVLRQPQNAEVLDRSVFLNALLLRKGVSWTKIFSDLEQVMPHNVRLMSVRPQITPRNELTLDMWVGSQSPEALNNFVMQLEQSPVFGRTTVPNNLSPTQNEPLYRYRVTVNYAQRL